MSKTKPSENEKIFNEIYQWNKWYFGSGTGSVFIWNKPWINFLNTFLESHKDIKIIVDLGCGDWQLGQYINLENREYIGCDVSSYVLEKTKKKFSSKTVSFLHLDAIYQEIPSGDLLIVKDVLLHLSTKDISVLLEKFKKYKYVIIAHSIYKGGRVNEDTTNGQFQNVDITEPPFNAPEYELVSTYVEGINKYVNLLRRLFGRPIHEKRIYLKS